MRKNEGHKTCLVRLFVVSVPDVVWLARGCLLSEMGGVSRNKGNKEIGGAQERARTNERDLIREV